MSTGPIARSPDLLRLRDDGFEIEIVNGYLVVRHIPYVNARREVVYGTLASRLELSGDKASRPRDHVALWVGEYPCDKDGKQLGVLVNNANLSEQITTDCIARHSFSQKPAGGYPDYYQKMTTYARILEGEAHAIDSGATSRTFPLVKDGDTSGPFEYTDTASSRAGITEITSKVAKGRIGIVGLGGTGSYVLDLIAKCPVSEIHLFDGDKFLQHNAFRSPGAPSIASLEQKPAKVSWFADSYSRMKRNIVPHEIFIDEETLVELDILDFVFLCLDSGSPKRKIVRHLIDRSIPFIDVGMGLTLHGSSIRGSMRVTTCVPGHSGHLEERISYGSEPNDEYHQNVQIAELNALNAALAIIKWKKLQGYYVDLENELHSVYAISTDCLSNDVRLNEVENNPA